MVRYTPMMRAPVLDTASSSSRAAFALGSAACVGALTFGAARYMRSSRLMCSDAASSERAGEDILLADISVGASHVLLTSPSSVAFSGLQPIVPGHSIVAPLRPMGRAPELSDAEWLDLWRTARRAQAAVEARHGAGASNLLLKDGTARLPHLHAHVVPLIADSVPPWIHNSTLLDGLAFSVRRVFVSMRRGGRGRCPTARIRAAPACRRRHGSLL